MSKQYRLDDIDRSEAPIRESRRTSFLLDMGASHALKALVDELKTLQKQHPQAVGLTLAIAIAGRDAAERAAEVSKEVLFTAGTNGMQMDGRRIELQIIEGVPVVASIADDSESVTA